MSLGTPGSTSRTRKSSEYRRSDSSPSCRRSPRLSASQKTPPPPAATPQVVVKRAITVRKIVPKKAQSQSEANKENVDRLSEVTAKKPKVSTPTPAAFSAPPPAHLSPILPPKTASVTASTQDSGDDAWSQKVRRSYSRLSAGDHSFTVPTDQTSSSPSTSRRETLFGFERMRTPEVKQKSVSRVANQTLGSFVGETEDSVCPLSEPDPNIPGVAVLKKNPRKKKVQPIKISELDLLAAKMNAEFEEAEGFELVVE
ncbi:sororin [Denticeps clupeoides]|uniref:Sororin n=1 Tax=Denticeps clupeoides TaxID=299321 RepID=A0AAY4DMA0_9TELE|nr:sororin [Denticeps clupeoides]